jgi:hypothetical protein
VSAICTNDTTRVATKIMREMGSLNSSRPPTQEIGVDGRGREARRAQKQGDNQVGAGLTVDQHKAVQNHEQKGKVQLPSPPPCA